MEDRTELTLHCGQCEGTFARPLRWVQENNFFVCPTCGANELIDKDAATLRFRMVEQLVG